MSPSSNPELFAKAVQNAIKTTIDEICDEETAKAVSTAEESIIKRIRNDVAGIAAKVLGNYSMRMDRNELHIVVKTVELDNILSNEQSKS